MIAKNNSGVFSTGSQTFIASLTVWSSRRPQAALVGALRTSCSGAAYRGRYASLGGVANSDAETAEWQFQNTFNGRHK